MNNIQSQALAAPAVTRAGWSSIAKKVLMAVTGGTFILFVTGHMVGNLQLFLGQDQLNKYAAALQHLGGLLWIIRLLLLGFLTMHIWTGVRLYLQNRSARPGRYAKEDTVQASLSSRTMFWTGLGVLLYVVYHLAHFTFLTTNPEYVGLHDSLGRHDVYSMVILGYQNGWISATYILAMAFIALHVNHALPSLLQTLGLTKPKYRTALKRLGNLAAIVLFVGYVSMPVAVLAGYITLPGGGH
ncbi:MAG: succinate dehydrogenase cytochrome b subunit [bacterium]